MPHGDEWYLLIQVLAGVFLFGVLLAAWPKARRAAKRIMALSALAEVATVLAYILSPDAPWLIDYLVDVFQRVLGG